MKSQKIDFVQLQKGPREWLHQARNWSKADVWRAEWPLESGQFVVVKDMRPRPLWFKALAGRYFLKREGRALRALDGMESVPRFLGMPNPDCLIMEWKAGRPVFDYAKGEIPPAALDNLARVVKEVHARGVTHGDLHRENVLVADDDTISLIDWATASVFGTSQRWTKREWISLDDRAVAKIKFRHAPHLLDQKERDLLLNGSLMYSTIRNFGHKFRSMRGSKPKRTPAEVVKRYSEGLENAGLLSEAEKKRP
jgi:serine/threonine protein kinase